MPEEWLEPFCLAQSDSMELLHVLDGEGQMQAGVAAFVTLWSALPY